QEVLGDLLGNGGGALGPAAAAVLLYVERGGTHDAGEVDAAVLVEILVLGRDEGVDDELGHCLDRSVEPPLARIFGEQRSVGGMHPRHHRGLIVLQLGVVRQRLGEVPQQAGRRRDRGKELGSSPPRTTGRGSVATIAWPKTPCPEPGGCDICRWPPPQPAKVWQMSPRHAAAAAALGPTV